MCGPPSEASGYRANVARECFYDSGVCPYASTIISMAMCMLCGSGVSLTVKSLSSIGGAGTPLRQEMLLVVKGKRRRGSKISHSSWDRGRESSECVAVVAPQGGRGGGSGRLARFGIGSDIEFPVPWENCRA